LWKVLLQVPVNPTLERTKTKGKLRRQTESVYKKDVERRGSVSR
jgi:hypothetical protein